MHSCIDITSVFKFASNLVLVSKCDSSPGSSIQDSLPVALIAMDDTRYSFASWSLRQVVPIVLGSMEGLLGIMPCQHSLCKAPMAAFI